MYSVENNYVSHECNEEQVKQMEIIRHMCKLLASHVDSSISDSREKSIAFTKLEEFMFWTNASISRYK